jgi:hypothetical protein
MNRFTAIALAAVVLTPIAAHADDGQWMDTRHHLALGNLPDSSEPIARLAYAKADCRAKTGAGQILTRADADCLKAEGFVWLPDSPAQIAARDKAVHDAAARETLHAIGGVLLDAAAAMQPHGCNGHVQPNGYFSTQCF